MLPLQVILSLKRHTFLFNLFYEMVSSTKKQSQCRYYIGTWKYTEFSLPSPMPEAWSFFCGQREVGGQSEYEHFQFVVGFRRSTRFNKAKSFFPACVHLEAVKDLDNALDYCHKSDTAIEHSYVELGVRPVRRNSSRDWTDVWDAARSGDLESIDPQILVTHYNNLKRIRADFVTPPVREGVQLFIYWGLTGSGKSYRAFQEAKEDGVLPYFKSSSNKWWDGYRGETCVVIDEFEGKVSIDHILRWVNWLPCLVETKGGTIPLNAVRFWITSNLKPTLWWPDCPDAQYRAFLRRVSLEVYFNNRFLE